MNKPEINILLIEDDEGDAFLLEEILLDSSLFRFSINWCDTLKDGLRLLDQPSAKYDIILLDLSLSDSFGLETFTKLYDRCSHLPVIVLSHNDDASLAIKAVKRGAQDYLSKGDFTQKSLVRAITYAIERKQSAMLLAEMHSELELRIEQINRTNLELRRMSQVKDQLLANVSHELRTPLTSIIVTLDVLQRGRLGKLNEQQIERLNRIRHSGKQLQQLFDNILDISESHLGYLDFEPTPVELRHICERVLNEYRETAASQNISILFQYDTAVTTIEADENRLARIISNLLSNALKFTDKEGKVGLKVEHDQDPHFVRLCVWDTGIGIESKTIHRIFEPFIQLDGSDTRPYGGAGIGLTLVKEFIQLHKGWLEIASEPGQGSCITAVLPINYSYQTIKDAPRESVIQFVDENPTARADSLV